MGRHNQNKPTAIYRHRDIITGEPVYYGIAKEKYQLSSYESLEQRFPRANSKQRSDIHTEFMEEGECFVDFMGIFKNQREAKRYERKLIEKFKPIFNIAHNSDNPPKKPASYE